MSKACEIPIKGDSASIVSETVLKACFVGCLMQWVRLPPILTFWPTNSVLLVVQSHVRPSSMNQPSPSASMLSLGADEPLFAGEGEGDLEGESLEELLDCELTDE